MLSPLDYAKRMMGMSEVPNQAQLQDYLSTGGANLDPATTAWCAAFVNASLKHAGVNGTGSNMARSFLKWGQGVDTPATGDIGVLPRGNPNGPYGHVGFVDSFNPKTNMVTLLAGNQGNAVSEKQFPLAQFLGFRRAPTDAPIQSAAPDPSSPAGGARAASEIQPFGTMAPQPAPGGVLANWFNGTQKDADAINALENGSNKPSPLQRLGHALMNYPDAPQARSAMPGPSATNGDALLKYLQQPQALAQMLLRKRLGQG